MSVVGYILQILVGGVVGGLVSAIFVQWLVNPEHLWSDLKEIARETWQDCVTNCVRARVDGATK